MFVYEVRNDHDDGVEGQFAPRCAVEGDSPESSNTDGQLIFSKGHGIVIPDVARTQLLGLGVFEISQEQKTGVVIATTRKEILHLCEDIYLIPSENLGGARVRQVEENFESKDLTFCFLPDRHINAFSSQEPFPQIYHQMFPEELNEYRNIVRFDEFQVGEDKIWLVPSENDDSLLSSRILRKTDFIHCPSLQKARLVGYTDGRMVDGKRYIVAKSVKNWYPVIASSSPTNFRSCFPNTEFLSASDSENFSIYGVDIPETCIEQYDGKLQTIEILPEDYTLFILRSGMRRTGFMTKKYYTQQLNLAIDRAINF